jgi:glycosyltransferase involved in cell wall biosynthesis
MTPPSILILSGVRGDTWRYRSVHLAEQAAQEGMKVTLAHAWQVGLHRLVNRHRFDFAIFQRVEMDRFLMRLVDALKNKGTIILYDTDDLVFDQEAFRNIDSPDFSDPLRARLYLRSMSRQKEMLLASDAVLVSTDYLVKQVRRLNKPVWVHRNAFNQEMLALSDAAFQSRKDHAERIVLGYASGTRTHDRDLAVASPAIMKTMQQYPQVELWLVGEVDPGKGWEQFGQRVRRIPKVDWRELPSWLAQFDINLAPLVAGNPFAESKSAIKYMEAALVKCPTVAANCAEFRRSIRDGENGFLAFGEHDWQEKLTRLVEDAGLRREMGNRTYVDVLEKDHPLVRSKELLTTLNEICMSLRGFSLFGDLTDNQSSGDANQVGFTPQQLDRVPGDIQRGWVTLWRRGPLEVLGGIWVGVRRLLAPIFPFRKRRTSID